MNRLQLYLQQIPQRLQMMNKIVSSNASTKLANRLFEMSIKAIENLAEECASSVQETEHSFSPILNLLGEVIKTMQPSRSSLCVNQSLVNTNCDVQENENDQCYQDIRETVRKAHEEYSRTLQAIPKGYKILAFQLGQAVIKLSGTFGQCFPISSKASGRSLSNKQIFHFISSFSETFDSFIEIYQNQTTDIEELQSYQLVFQSYVNMFKILPATNFSRNATDLVQRAMKLVNEILQNRQTDISDQLQTLVNDNQPYVNAEELNSRNPIVLNEKSSNILLVEKRLTRIEKGLKKYYTNHLKRMKQLRKVTTQFDGINVEQIDLTEIVKMLEEIFRLFRALQENWSKKKNLFLPSGISLFSVV